MAPAGSPGRPVSARRGRPGHRRGRSGRPVAQGRPPAAGAAAGRARRHRHHLPGRRTPAPTTPRRSAPGRPARRPGRAAGPAPAVPRGGKRGVDLGQPLAQQHPGVPTGRCPGRAPPRALPDDLATSGPPKPQMSAWPPPRFAVDSEACADRVDRPAQKQADQVVGAWGGGVRGGPLDGRDGPWRSSRAKVEPHIPPRRRATFTAGAGCRPSVSYRESDSGGASDTTGSPPWR
jgi:hypothetical protein